jgi:hypothetical protein
LGYDLRGAVSVAVCVCVKVEKGAFINLSVAVVVFEVAAFVCARKGTVVGVVAVGILKGAVLRQFAYASHKVGVAKAVTVLVEVRKQAHAFVNEAIAVVVDAVAHFYSPRVDGGVCLIAVLAAPKPVEVGIGGAGRE